MRGNAEHGARSGKWKMLDLPAPCSMLSCTLPTSSGAIVYPLLLALLGDRYCQTRTVLPAIPFRKCSRQRF